MDDSKNVGGRDRLLRWLLTVVLSIVSVRELRRGKRLRGLLAGVGALGFGFTATTGYCGCNDALDVDTTASADAETTERVDVDLGDETTSDGADPVVVSTDEADGSEAAADTRGLTCAFCGEPIVPGQRRGPNSQGDIVHDTCG